MATANEIEAYNGDPKIGFGSSVAAGETGLAWDLSAQDLAWAKYAQNKLDVAKDLNDQLKKKQLKEQEEIAKIIDAKQYVGWEKSDAWLKPKVDEFRKLVVDVAKGGNWDNYNDPDFNRVLTMRDELLQGVEYSMQQKQYFLTGDSHYQQHTDEYQPTSRESLDAYANESDPFKRAQMDYVLEPNTGFDLGKIVKDLERDLTTGKTTRSTTHKDQYGQLVTDIEDVQQMDLSNLPARLDDLYKTDPKIRRTADEIYSTLTPGQQAQYGNNPAQTLQTPVLERLNATTTEKQQFRTDWQAQFTARADITKPLDSEIVDYTLELTDPNSQRFDFDKGDGQKFAYAASPFYVVKVGLKPVPIDGFVNDDGKLFAIPKGQLQVLGEGKFDWDKTKLIPITDPSSQFISPTLSLKGRTAAEVQDVQNYGNRVDTENKLKIPKGQNVSNKVGSSQSSGSGGTQPTQYEEEKTVKGVKYGRKGKDWYVVPNSGTPKTNSDRDSKMKVLYDKQKKQFGAKFTDSFEQFKKNMAKVRDFNSIDEIPEDQWQSALKDWGY